MVYEDQHIPELSGRHENEHFRNCTVCSLKNAVLERCTFHGTHFKVDSLKEALGLTLTLDCQTFSNLELSETLFDALLLLLCKTKGNTMKRRALIEQVIGRKRAAELLAEMAVLEGT